MPKGKSRCSSCEGKRPTARQRGYDTRWEKHRLEFLREHPCCVECAKLGIVTPADVADHIKPHKGDPVLFWDKKNLQGLCFSHHNAKSARERGEWSPT